MRLRTIIYAFASLILMSLASCNKPDDGSNDLMYIWFEVSGKVVDQDGHPIAGITVMAESADSKTTAPDGTFTINGGSAPTLTTAVKFVDADNAGKQYMPKSVMVDLVKYKDGHGWNNGYYRNAEELTVVMMESQATITPSPLGSSK